MQRLNDTNLKESLKSGVRKLYLVAGNDAFLIDACISLIVKTVLGESRDGLFRVGQKELRNGDFEELFYNFSLLGQRRVAVVDDFSQGQPGAEEKKLFEALLPIIPDDVNVIFRIYGNERRFSLSKGFLALLALQDNSALVSVSAKEGQQQLRYIESLAKREGCDIEPEAVRALAMLCGDDLQLISNEIKKMAALAGYGMIGKREVALLGIRTAEAGVFQMMSAVEAGNIKRSAELLHRLLEDLVNPLAIASVLDTAFVNLYRARLTRDAGHTMSYMIDQFGYKKGDRKVLIAFEQCMRYSLPKLKRILGILLRLDRRLKSTVVDTRYVLEQHVIEIASIVAS